jgi:hypothetical protein
VWAKKALERFMRDQGWPFRRWTEFAEIHRWLDHELAAFAAGGALPGPVTRHPFCGSEAWGPGRIDPPQADQRPPLEGRIPG